MKKLIIFSVIACLGCTLTASCQKTKEKGKSDSAVSQKSDLSNSECVSLTLKNDTFTPLKETVQKFIEIDEFDDKKLDKSIDGKIISSCWVNDKIVIESFNKNDTNTIELGILDPYSNNYNKKTDIPFTAAYRNNTEIISDRYYITANSYYENDSLTGKILAYDTENGNLTMIDEFAEYNIVQYVSAAGENGVAYFYYDGETADWVVKYYDLSKNESKEIFRHSNDNDTVMSPVSLAYDGKNVVLLVQSIDDEANGTKFVLIDCNTESYTVEDLDLYKFFYNEEYEISDLYINGDMYYIQANIRDSYECYIFDRSENDFRVVLPAVYHLNEIIGVSANNSVAFAGTTANRTHEIYYDVNPDSGIMESYSTFSQSSKNNVDSVRISNTGDESEGYYYNMVSSYKSQATQSNTALFMYPDEQLQNALKNRPEDEYAFREMFDEQRQRLCDEDFRWRYAYAN